MCLCKNHWLPKISCKPKYVYKVVYYIKSEEKTVMYSAFKGAVIEPDKPIKASKSWIRSLFTKNITGEGIHAYKSKLTAVQAIDDFNSNCQLFSSNYFNTLQGFMGFSIVNAIIPPYTFYWEGKWDEIAATKMIILNSTNNG